MKSKKSCPQNKCIHNQIGVGQGCRPCEECGCSPNLIDENCDRCKSCCSDEGVLRWDDSFFGQVVNSKEKINVVEIK